MLAGNFIFSTSAGRMLKHIIELFFAKSLAVPKKQLSSFWFNGVPKCLLSFSLIRKCA